MKNNIRFHVVLVLILGLVSVNANAALMSRLDGQAVYDTDLNITWLADAHYLQNFSDPYGNPLGQMSWGAANNQIDLMNAENGGLGHLGFNDWRLPTADLACDALYTACGEMGHLFYNELGGVAGTNIVTTHNTNYSLFQNLPPASYAYTHYIYWTGTNTIHTDAYFFDFNAGVQLQTNRVNALYAMAVRPGDVAAVPLPAAFWLFGSGLVGLLGFMRRRKS